MLMTVLLQVMSAAFSKAVLIAEAPPSLTGAEVAPPPSVPGGAAIDRSLVGREWIISFAALASITDLLMDVLQDETNGARLWFLTTSRAGDVRHLSLPWTRPTLWSHRSR